MTDAEEALGIANAEHDDRLAAIALESLAWAYAQQGQVLRSLELNRAGTTLARSLDDRFAQTQFAIARGVALASLGKDARTAFQEALDLARHNRDQSHTAFALGNLGYLDLLQGNLSSARTRSKKRSISSGSTTTVRGRILVG